MTTDRQARLVAAYDRRATERDGWEPEPWKLELADDFLTQLPARPPT